MLYCLLLAFLLLATPAWAPTPRYVATNGTDTSCVAAGNLGTPARTIGFIFRSSCMSTGDILYARGGTYSESINSGLIAFPQGTSYANAPVLSSYPGETATITQPSTSGAAIILDMTSNTLQYIIFKDLILDGGYQNVKIGTGSQPSNHIKFDNIEAKNGWHQCVSWQTGAQPTHDNWWTGGKVHHCGYGEAVAQAGYAFYVGGNDQLIENAEIYDVQGHCVHVYDSIVPPNRAITRNNYVHDCAAQNSNLAGMLIDGINNQIYNNIVTRSAYGITTFSASVGALVYNNTVYANSQFGLFNYPGSSTTQWKNNIIYQNTGGPIRDLGSGSTTATNLTTNPSFVNAAANDYHLQSSSAAKDMGTNLSPTVTTDKDSVPRPQGSAYDIGAYEFVLADTTPPAPPTGLQITKVTGRFHR